MTAERQFALGAHSITAVNPDGSLVVKTHGGREVTFPASVILNRLAQSLNGLQDPNSSNTAVSTQLALDAETINRQQFLTGFGLIEAATQAAITLNPAFNATGRTPEDKMNEIRALIVSTGDALVDFEQRRLEVAQLDFMQSMLSTAGEMFAKGMLGTWLDFLSPTDRKRLASLMTTAIDLSITRIAGQIPEAQIQQGGRNRVEVARAKAEANQAPARASLETDRTRIEISGLKEELKDQTAKKLLERNKMAGVNNAVVEATRRNDQIAALAKRAGDQQALVEKRTDHLVKTVTETAGIAAEGLRSNIVKASESFRDFWIDPQTGVPFKLTELGTKMLNKTVDTISSPRVVGATFVGAGGFIGGVFASAEALYNLKTVMEVTTATTNVVFGITTTSMSVAGIALGGYLGPKVVDLANWTRKKFVDWKDSPDRKWNKNKQTQNLSTPNTPISPTLPGGQQNP